MPLNLQVKLLRVLQEKVVVRVGENRPEPVDIRILTATNRTLEDEIKHNRFREDLYYRLNVVNIHLPPLRDRGEDVMVIAKYLLHRYSQEFGGMVKGLSPNAVIAIRKFAWPGNIRQLENHLKKAVVLADKALLGPEDMGLSAGTCCRRSCRSPTPKSSFSATTSTRCSSGTTATAPRPRAISASILGRSFVTSRRKTAPRTAAARAPRRAARR